MKTTVTQYDFREGFQGVRHEHFSYDGLNALFEHLTEIEHDAGEEIEFNPNDLCCEYSEYTLEELFEFFPEVVECLDNPYDWIGYFQHYTEVIRVDSTTIILRDY